MQTQKIDQMTMKMIQALSKMPRLTLIWQVE